MKRASTIRVVKPGEEAASNKDARMTDQRPILSSLIDLTLLLPATLFYCFYNLSAAAVGKRDESLYVLATQGMEMTGQWWMPTMNGRPFFFKPPFKMWWMLGSIELFGNTKFALRLTDAVVGVLTVLLTYALARMWYRSRVAGLVAGFSLLGSSAYILNHGPRMAVQDAMVVFLTTLALLCAWKVLEASEKGARATSWAVFGGLVVAAAVLTKTAAGYLPLIILGAYLVVSGELVRVLRVARREVFWVVGLSIFIPALYFVPHSLFSPGAYDLMIQEEVIDRATKGFHNTQKHFFYLTRLFSDRSAVPPELILAGLLAAALWFVRTKEKKHLFVLVWAITPVLAFSLSRSRLTWYISPAFPAMAILAGAVVAASLAYSRQQLSSWWKAESRLELTALFAGVFALVGIGLVAQSMLGVAQAVYLAPKTHAVDRLTSDIQRTWAKHGAQMQVVHYEVPKPAFLEIAYKNMIRPVLLDAQSVEEAKQLIQDEKTKFFLTASADVYPFLFLRPITGYLLAAPQMKREQWIAALSYEDATNLEHFTPAKRIIDFGSSDFEALYGWGAPGTAGKLNVRWSKGMRAGLSVRGDWMLQRLGSKAFVNMTLHQKYPQSRLDVAIYLNDIEVGEIPVRRGKIETYEFSIPPDVWQSGKNALSFIARPKSGDSITADQQLMMFNWLSLRLKQH